MEKRLKAAIELSKNGEKEQARELLRELVDDSPDTLTAWFWLADAMPDEEGRVAVLREALEHHPDNPQLLRALTILQPENAPQRDIETDDVPAQDSEDSPPEFDLTEEEIDVNPPVDQDQKSSSPKKKKKKSSDSVLSMIVFLLVLAAAGLGWLFRDSLKEILSISQQAVIATATVTLPAATETPTVAQEPLLEAIATPTSTKQVLTATQSPQEGVSTETPVFIVTPTYTAVVEEGKFIPVLGSQINDIVWSQDGDQFAVAGDGGIVIYDGETFTERLAIRLEPAIPILTVTFSPNGQYIAAGFDQAKSGEELITRARLWRVSDGAELMSFDYNESRGDIDTVAFSADGEILLTNAMLDMVMKWRVADGALLEVYPLSASAVNYYGVAFSPDRLSFATYSRFDRVRIYDTLFGVQSAVLGDEKGISNAVFSPNNQYLAVMLEDQPVVYLWDLPSEVKIREWNTFSGNVTALAFNPDNQTLAVATAEDLIKFYLVRTGEEQRVISRQIPGVTQIAFSPDDTLFAVRNPREVQVWHLLTDTLVATFRVTY